jgi:hypothetical protein
MLHKYSVLKSSWGIVIFLEIEEILNPEISGRDIKIADRIFLRINDTRKMSHETILTWVGPAFKTLSDEIYKKVNGLVVCYNINLLDFNYVDFQEEGLYCAAREWIAKYYDLQVESIQVDFDKAKNKYIYHLPPLSL